jgi:choline dehydrogenase-like flavoprotein
VTQNVFTAKDVTESRIEECDVCIIGSGAGGGTLAANLTAAGKRVVMLEAGPYYTRKEFALHEAAAFQNLYQERGTRATDDQAITIMQGRNVGGGTTINWTSCFRIPERVLSMWRDRFGLTDLTTQRLMPLYEKTEQRLNINTWPLANANANNNKLISGAQALNYEISPLRRNVLDCLNSGYCGFGCPVDRKQGMLVTTIADALKGGMQLFAEAPVQKLVHENGKIKEVIAQMQPLRTNMPSSITVRVRPKTVVLSAGAINSPALLLKSDLNVNQRVGQGLFLHPVIGMSGLYEEAVNGFYGAPQSASSHEFIEREEGIGFFLESAPIHPALSSVAFKDFGTHVMDLMSELSHVGIMIAIHADGFLPEDKGGSVKLHKDGRVGIEYPIGHKLKESFKEAHDVLAQVTFKAGAKKATSFHFDPVMMDSDAERSKLNNVKYGALEHAIFSAHQMGGCAMGADPKTSVVDPDFRYRELDNLFVADGSLFPSSLGVNPSQTIYTLAHLASEKVLAATS